LFVVKRGCELLKYGVAAIFVLALLGWQIVAKARVQENQYENISRSQSGILREK